MRKDFATAGVGVPAGYLKGRCIGGNVPGCRVLLLLRLLLLLLQGARVANTLLSPRPRGLLTYAVSHWTENRVLLPYCGMRFD